MRVLGIVVKPGSCPILRCVVLEGDRGSPTVTTAFELKTAESLFADQVVELGRMARSQLGVLQSDRVVIRVADTASVPSRWKAAMQRQLIEGGVTYACHEQTKSVIVRSGKE